MEIEFDTTVRNGFPVSILATLTGSPRQRTLEVESVEVFTRAGKPASFLKLSLPELERVEALAVETALEMES